MTTHQQALEAAVLAHDKEEAAMMGEPDPWADDRPEQEFNCRIFAMDIGIRAYLTTLAPADNGLVAELRKLAEIRHAPSTRHSAEWRAADTITAQAAEIEQDRRHIEKLQAALAFWMPGVSEEIEIELDGRAGDDAYLLAGFEGEVPSPSWGDKMQAEIERLKALLDKAVWQPIETAPHNHSVLLGWRDWRDGSWCMEVGPASWGTRVGAASNMSGHGSATHWMPLPAAPTLTAIKEARNAGN